MPCLFLVTASRMRVCAFDTAARLCVRTVTLLIRILLGPAPSLHGLRSGRLVHLLRRCLGEFDFSIVLIGGYGSQPSRQPPSHDWRGRDGDLPVPAQKACVHARVYDDAGSTSISRMRRPPFGLLLVQKTSAPRTWLTPLNTSPAHPPMNASRHPSRTDVHHSGPVRLARPYTVAKFHRLPSAGLPALPDHPIRRHSPRSSPHSHTLYRVGRSPSRHLRNFRGKNTVRPQKTALPRAGVFSNNVRR